MQILARASDEATDVGLRAAIEHRRGRLRILGGAVGEAVDGLSAAARRLEGHDRTLAAEMLADAGLALLLSRGTDAARATADRALELARGAPDDVLVGAQLLVARLLASTGHPVAALPIPPSWRGWLQQGEAPVAVHRLEYVGSWFLWYLDPAGSATILDEAVARARASSALGTLPVLLAYRGDARFRLGRWLEAGADLAECLHLADEMGRPGVAAGAEATLARLEGARGREAAATEIGARAITHADALGFSALPTYALSALGLLGLGLRRFPSAIARLEEAERRGADGGWIEPSASGGMPDLVEAYIRVRRLDDARHLIRHLHDVAASGHPWTCGALARCEGLLEPTPRFETMLREAIVLHASAIAPFEIGRDRLILGERLRRAGRRAEAREELGQALSIFDRLDAIPWSEAARTELVAAGAQPSPPRPPRIDGLTPHEIQVAQLVAQGATNREAASALFVTPKTIEYHLRNIYGKLAVRSRAELARLVAREWFPD